MIPAGKVAKYFFDKFPSIRPSTNGWYEFDWPFCGTNKGAIHFEAGRVKCWRGCYSGDVRHFVAEVERVTPNQAWKMLVGIDGEIFLESSQFKVSPKLKEEQAIPFPDFYHPLSNPTPLLGQRAIAYLEGRGFDVGELDEEGWGYCTDGRYYGRIIIPFFVQGKLRYFQGRTFLDNPLRYDNPKREDIGVGKEDVIYNEDALSLYDRVFILEGAFDAKCLGREATSTQGWSLSRWQRSKYLNSRAKEIVLVPDVGYYRKALETALTIAPVKPVRVLDLSVFSQWGKDVNEIGRDRVLSLIDSSELMDEMDVTLKLL